MERHCRNDIAAQVINCATEFDADGRLLSAHLRIRANVHQLSAVNKSQTNGAFLRFPFDMMQHGRIIGNCAFDIDLEISNADDLWLVQIQTQCPGDSYFPYHPTALLLRKPDDSILEYKRLGYATLGEDQFDFFDACAPVELTIV